MDEALEQVEESEPPVPSMISREDWANVSRLLAEYLVEEERGQEVLEELEKHGARLMLSPDQKRARPGIGRKLFKAAGVKIPEEQQLQLLSAVEGVHFYTKGIDDIQDGDLERNDLPTLHRYASHYLEDDGSGLFEPRGGVIGRLASLIPAFPRQEPDVGSLGDHIANNYFLSVKSRVPGMISGLDSLSYEQREQLRYAIDESQQRLADGQNLDLAGTEIGEGRLTPNYLGGDLDVMAHLHDTNEGKTAELFALLGRFTRIISEEYDGDELEQWGREAGQAFQVTDDVLDLEHGRNSDIEGKNYTVPIYIAERYLHSLPEEETPVDRWGQPLDEKLTRLLRKEDPSGEQAEEANRIITEETPAVEASYKLASHLTEHATGYEGREDMDGVPLDEVDWEDETYIEEVRQLSRLLGYQREK
ncbi:MAG: polyprenyl synthetase family protein [Candidatus Nanohaloarchaea archaeon]